MKKLTSAALLGGILLQLSVSGHAAEVNEPGARREFAGLMAQHSAVGHAASLQRKTAPSGAWSAANIPEPAIWAMLILCFGVVGGALRSARR